MAERGRLSHRLILGVFCVGALLGAYRDGDGAGGAPEHASLRPETPPGGGAGGNGNVCEGEILRCKNNPTRLCDCGYICPDDACLPAPPNCEEHTDCPSGVCEGGKCRCIEAPGVDQCNPKVSDKHTYTCNSAGFCMQLPDQCNVEGAPCGDDGICRRSQCHERCSSDRDCPASLVCKKDRFCGAALVPDGPPLMYSCAAGGGKGDGGDAWLFVIVGIAATIRARSRR
ncbi:hypothetical protein [Polyangium sp. 15x6]|uniref:hypothetical protein n=1 Tax=Polyangium sp. 15x6 TaxID=3042687 RepID=UPI00249C321F|nr:hypothetical protein [Polyangium sp. 15x6]MDI3287479.1 hypothetical protein [Polyangium sp. 15x6]